MSPFVNEQKPHSTSSLDDDTQKKNHPELDGNDTEAVAIIGFSFQFPDDVDTPDGFWKMLLGRCAARDFLQRIELM